MDQSEIATHARRQAALLRAIGHPAAAAEVEAYLRSELADGDAAGRSGADSDAGTQEMDDDAA